MNSTLSIIDVQNSKSIHKIGIDKVGIKNLIYPIVVPGKEIRFQHTIGKFSLFVDLPEEKRGTHMSRFIEVLNRFNDRVLYFDVIDELVLDVKNTLDSMCAYVEVSFPFFVEKHAPISKITSKLDYECRIIQNYIDARIKRYLEVKVPITTLCPCSKAISDAGAHNQRGTVTLLVEHQSIIWIEDLINLVENEASCEIFPLLKRVDEKFVTEKAYSNPAFVEDIVRKISAKLYNIKEILGFQLECENQESIHNHAAFARIEVNL